MPDKVVMPPSASSEILFARRGPLAIVTLNRPAALNAQNLAMVRAFAAQLQLWEADPTVTRLFLHGAGGKAFCAGGDVRALWSDSPARRLAFFTAEYALCAALRATRLETIAYMDGVTMGGGVGLSIHLRHRLATAQTVWAMPEVAIGFYPDICASHFLPRLAMNGQPAPALGRALALTGLRLAGADCVGIVANHFMDSGQDAALIAALAGAETVEAALAPFARPTPRCELSPLGSGLAPSADLPLPQFLALLVQQGLLPADYERTLCALSLCVTDAAFQRGAGQDFAATLAMDHTVVGHFLAGTTFYEGVRARLIDRDGAPSWASQRVEDIDPVFVAGYFE